MLPENYQKTFFGGLRSQYRRFRMKFMIPPTIRAKVVIRENISNDVLVPRSFIIMKKLARQGTKRVRVTMLIMIWFHSKSLPRKIKNAGRTVVSP
jgi:hypothetical protein